MRSLVPVILALVSFGCQQSSSTFDPFSTYGPTQIPPPPTGTAGRPDPYYRRATNQANPGSLSVFTSDDNAGQMQVADQRGTVEATAPNEGNVEWRSPAAGSNVPATASEPLAPRPRLPDDRRLGGVTVEPPNEPVVLGSGVNSAQNVNGADRLLSPQPQATPAAFQQPVQPPIWKTRY